MFKESVLFGADDLGKVLKDKLIESLGKKQGFEDLKIVNIPVDENLMYPEIAKKIASDVIRVKGLGILVSSIGADMCTAANKILAARAVTCHDTLSAGLTRAHMDANILCIGSDIIGVATAQAIMASFLLTPFVGKEQDLEKINLIREMENENLDMKFNAKR